MPQFGWQPQLSWPHSAAGPWTLVGPVGEGSHERDGKPVARRLADARLTLHVVREVGERVALRSPPLGRDLFVASGEGDWLERDERDLPRVVEGELDDPPDLLVVHPVDDRHDRDDVHAGVPEVLDRAELDVEKVVDAAVRVGGVADAVELQVCETQSGLGRPAAELGALGELDAIGRRLDAAVAELHRIADRVEEVGRDGRLAARELHRHLPARLDGDGGNTCPR